MRGKNKFSFILLILMGIFLFSAGHCHAAGNSRFDIMVFNGNDLTVKNSINAIPEEFTGTTRLAIIKDSANQEVKFAVSYGNTDNPRITIYNCSSEIFDEWQPYPSGFKGEISLAAADLDNDGEDEIITGAGVGGGPQVGIFDQHGRQKFVAGFWAYDQGYRNGIEVAAGDINGDGNKEILVSIVDKNMAIIRFFNREGKEVEKAISFPLEESYEPVKLAALDLGQDNVQEILVGLGSGNEPKIKIFRRDGSLIKEFLAYDKNFWGGVNFSVSKINGNNIIATGAGFSGGPHVRLFDSFGGVILKSPFFAYSREFHGGINVLYEDIDSDGEHEIITLAGQANEGDGQSLHKLIDVDISEQMLRYYQYGKLIGTSRVSTGRMGMPTPLGEFKIWQKTPRAYSKKYGLYMPWWMSFKPGYGIHELPEWPSGYKEGVNHLGVRVSHGCIRLGIGPAKKLYDFAPIGTAVMIHE